MFCSLSSYINLETSNLCSPKPLDIIMMGAFGLMMDCLMGWSWSSLLLLLVWLSLVWLILKVIHFTYELHILVIGMAIETRYCSYRSDFHKSDLSLKQFTLLTNFTLRSSIYLGPNAGMTAGLSSHKSRFICHFRIVILSRRIVLR